MSLRRCLLFCIRHAPSRSRSYTMPPRTGRRQAAALLAGARRVSSLAEGMRLQPASLSESVKATKVEYRQVGKSGLRVSNPIMGTMGFGNREWLSWCLEEDEASRILYEGYLRGINTWDTANTYSNGMAERIIGHTIQKYSIPRRKLVLMTKCGRVVGDRETSMPGDFLPFMEKVARQSKDYVNQLGASRSSILDAVDDSLERLQTKYIDVLLLHRYDPTVEPEETMETLHELVKAGKVRYLAASSMWAYQFARLQGVAEARGWTRFVAMQNHYNLLYREEEREMNRYCRETGVGLMPWSPLAEGALARPLPVADAVPAAATTAREKEKQKMEKLAQSSSSSSSSSSSTSTRSLNPSRFGNETGDADRAIIGRVHEVATRRGWSMSQVALAWLNRRTTAPVVGLHSVRRIDEALAARGLELSAEEEAYLEEPYRPKAVQGHS